MSRKKPAKDRPTSPLQMHLRQTFLAGIFAVVPVAVTVFIIYWVDLKTSFISEKLFGHAIPFLGVLVAIVGIYVAGLIATSIIGRSLLWLIDSFLSRVPGLRQLYVAWKQVALTPGGTEGIFSRVVLIPDETGATQLLGFTSGRAIEGDPNTLCVFVPAAPNPINGRLYFVHRSRCQMVDVSVEEAFKVVLSTGNYVPPAIGEATKSMVLPQRQISKSA
jgi:uncharacterized membrane protein